MCFVSFLGNLSGRSTDRSYATLPLSEIQAESPGTV